MTQGTSPTFAYGSPVMPVALMPENTGLYTDPLNLIFGIQRQVAWSSTRTSRARVYIIVLTARIAFNVEESKAIVEYENIATD